jgi:hypothetical protein
MGEFSFRSLIKPGEGSRRAIQQDIQERTHRDPDGPHAYLKRHGFTFSGRVLPEDYDDVVGPPTQCHVNSLKACLAHPELRYFTGYYTVGREVCEHSWCVDPDGEVVETTYPTRDVEHNARMARKEGGPSDFGWLPPDHWSYFGLEFDAEFVEALIEHYGLHLPVYSQHCPYHADFLSHPYSVHGWPIPQTP